MAASPPVHIELRLNNDGQVDGSQVSVRLASNLFQPEKSFRSLLRTISSAYVFEEPQLEKEESDTDTIELENYLQGNLNALGERKRIGVIFKNLTVVGEGMDAIDIPTIGAPFVAIARKLTCRPSSKNTSFNILQNITGFCKDGEMLLVLGRPGAGCSTFLRVIANQRKSYKEVQGDVTYSGIPAAEFQQYLGENIYTDEEDVHFPSLTVKQTLRTALECKIPNERVRGQDREEFIDSLVNMLLKMFGLTRVQDTVAGNEWIRGLSGGERKRLTIAEAMMTHSAVMAWDNTTKGLDSISALDYVKCLRIMSNTLHRTNIASFYQASDDMYNLFDKVMVLDKGVCIYFGPVAQAKDYFEEMGYLCEPGKSILVLNNDNVRFLTIIGIPDFLTGITNANERKVHEGFVGKTIPNTPAEMADYYNKSFVAAEMQRQLQEYEATFSKQNQAAQFKEFIKEAKATGVSEKSIYTTNVWQQTRALFAREFRLIYKDHVALTMKLFAVLSKAFIYATAFLFCSLDSKGIYSRAGALCMAIMFNAMLSMSELPNAYRGRQVLHKHKTYALYHPAAFHLARVATVQTLLYSVSAYFLYGFQHEAGKFFIFWMCLFLTSLAMIELFRISGNLSKTYVAATQFASLFLVENVLYMGFAIPPPSMHPWFKWLIYVSPISYTFKAMMLNEIGGLNVPCKGEDIIPYGPSYSTTNTTYLSCSLQGFQLGGNLEVNGYSYLAEHFGYHKDAKTISIVAIFIIWVVYVIINCVILEFANLRLGGYIRQIYKRGKAPKQNDTEEHATVVDVEEKYKKGLVSNTDTTFMWSDIKYTIKYEGEKKQLLDNVEGWIKPGKMTALMGASGAGKTTLLDVLAQRKTIGVVEGTILLDGSPLGIDYERLTGYVEQMDVHNPGQTVREALQFSARMRQDASISLEEKYAYVEKVLEMMEMTSLGDALVGDQDYGYGISPEQQKRLTIGMELVGKPKILFLDEPTSGLDAQSSYNIIKFIRKLADQGMPLVCTIHQPSSVLFEYFDRILLLTHGGRTVYFGDIGERSRTLLNYFEKHAPKCRPNENPASYVIKVVNGKISKNTDWVGIWAASHEKQVVQEEIANMKKNEGSSSSSLERREFATNGWTQFWEVYRRLNLVWWRTPEYGMGRMRSTIIISLFLSLSYYHLSHSLIDMQNRVLYFQVFFFLMSGYVSLALPMFMKQRQYFRREYASKFYSWWPFAISIITVEIPYIIICAGLFTVLSYWTAGLQTTTMAGFYYFLMVAVCMIFTCSFGQLIASFCSTLIQAAITVPFLLPFMMMFAGVANPASSLPKFWRDFLYNVNPYHYVVEGLSVDVVSNIDITCKANELVPILLNPLYSTCGEYMSDYLAEAPGYLSNPNSTDVCKYCVYSTGTDFMESYFDWNLEHKWRNFGLLWCYVFFNICCIIFFVYVFRKASR